MQPQIGLSAGGPSTLGSWRIKVRIRDRSCRHASHTGRKSTPVDQMPTSNDFAAVRFNSVMNTGSTPFSLDSTRRRVYALPVDPADSGVRGSRHRSLTLLRERPMNPAYVIDCLEHVYVRFDCGNPTINWQPLSVWVRVPGASPCWWRAGRTEERPAGGNPRSGLSERLTAGVKMREITRGPEPFRGVISPLPRVPATRPRATSTAEPKPQSGPPANIFPSRPDCPLTAEQERLMVEHLPIVRFIARHIHKRLPQHVAIEDLYSAGVLGLVDAFHRYDPAKPNLFRTYAQFRIRGAILDSLRTLDWSPRELRRKGRAIEQAVQILTARTGRSPTDTEIAQELHINLVAYQQLLGDLKGLEIGKLYSERSDESGEEELVYAPGRPEDDPLFRYLDAEMRERLTKAIEALPERERMVMTLYYYEETTMREIGLILDVHESRVSQIHASAVLHLRAQLSSHATLGEPRS